MSERTSISWTDATFNGWWGCTKVSAGCDNCYAEALDHRYGGEHWGKGQPRREFGDKHWNEPLKWNRDALSNFGRKMRVFCASMSDVMDDEAPSGARARLWKLIDETPNLLWQLLTKRPQRYKDYLPIKFKYDNVVLGATMEDQKNYNLRWPILQNVSTDWNLPCWVSYEPALGPLTMMEFQHKPNWIVFGGESGSNHRPCEVQWAENLLKECRTARVRFFMKQMAARTPAIGKTLIPANLLIQEHI